MADQGVIKHTKIYKIWNSKEHGFWHKAKEFVLEIVIIVFAVSLSIWLHGRSEHAHQQEDVKEFMLGIRSDLQNDQAEMKEDREMYIKNKAALIISLVLKFHKSRIQTACENTGITFLIKPGCWPITVVLKALSLPVRSELLKTACCRMTSWTFIRRTFQN
jgi:hypothetical protein